MYIGLLLKMLYGEPLGYWFAHFLRFCCDNGFPMITNLEFNRYKLKFSPDQSYKYEINSLEDDILSRVEMYYLPDEFYGVDRGMKTKHSIHLFEDRDEVFEKIFDKILKEIQRKHPKEKIEGFISFGQGYKSLEYYVEEHGLKIIRGDVSPIRKTDGYTQVLYWATMNAPLYGAKQCEERYDKFLDENVDLPVFTRQEIIALLGKEDTLPLIPLMNAKPQYEMGICEGKYCIDPMWFVFDYQTADDLYFESRIFYTPKQIIKRQHPSHYMQAVRLENRRNAENFILSCKRNVTIASNTMMITMMWNRTACCANDTLAYNFMAERDFSSEKIVDLKFLNWLIFGYSVPGYENFFNIDYWKWRYSQPSETEIYIKHLNICLSKLNLTRDIFDMGANERLILLLEKRGCNQELIDDVLHSMQVPEDIQREQINFQIAVSALIYNGKKYYCRNKFHNGMTRSSFHIVKTTSLPLFFVPLGDIAGFIKIAGVFISDEHGNEIEREISDSRQFFERDEFRKIETDFNGSLHIVIDWSYDSIIDGLRKEKEK